MDNEEIKALLRELKARSDATNEVKGKTVRITFDDDTPVSKEKKSKKAKHKEVSDEIQETQPKEQQVWEDPEKDLWPSVHFDLTGEEPEEENAVSDDLPVMMSVKMQPERKIGKLEHVKADADAKKTGTDISESSKNENIDAAAEPAAEESSDKPEKKKLSARLKFPKWGGRKKETLQDEDEWEEESSESMENAEEEAAAEDLKEKVAVSEPDEESALEEPDAEKAGKKVRWKLSFPKKKAAKESDSVLDSADEEAAEKDQTADTESVISKTEYPETDQAESEHPKPSLETDRSEETTEKKPETSEPRKRKPIIRRKQPVKPEQTEKTAVEDDQKQSKVFLKKERTYAAGYQDAFESDEDDFLETKEHAASPAASPATSPAAADKEDKKITRLFKEENHSGSKTIWMILLGCAVLVVIGMLIYFAVFANKSSKSVIADQGLTVNVKAEPQVWVNSSPVELGIRTKQPILGITADGQDIPFEGTKKTAITVTAVKPELDLDVVTEEGTLHATIEIPMIDSQAPSVEIQKNGMQITMEALDTQSGVAAIYYGELEGMSDIPHYQLYTGPFAAKENRIYYYYAEDNAGNRTTPVCTNMMPAAKLVLSEKEISMFPGNEKVLSITAEPELAFFNHLQMTSADPDIATITDDGTIHAIKDGKAVIEISADGISKETCVVTVQSSATITISTIGDCTLGTDEYFYNYGEFDEVQSEKGNKYFFEKVAPILSADDLTFANFEGTLTTETTREEKQFAFKGLPSNTEILKEGSVEAVTLANNHSSDYGPKSLEDTKRYLTEAGIGYCKDDQILIKDVKGVKVALIGIYVLDEGMGVAPLVESTIANAKQMDADLIITAFHWGSEKSPEPDQSQITLAHLAVDCGADLVVGHHPHVLQGIEQYEGKYIVYSLGNFCFGGNTTPSEYETMIFQQTFTVDSDRKVKDYSKIKITPCLVSSSYGYNDYQPTPQTGENAKEIMDLINERSAMFGTVLPTN